MSRGQLKKCEKSHFFYLYKFNSTENLDNVELEITDGAVHAVAKRAIELKTGARGLRTIFENLMIDTMYDLPGDKTVSEVIVTEKCVLDGAAPKLVKKKSSKSKEVAE